jgi:hypothetical protein
LSFNQDHLGFAVNSSSTELTQIWQQAAIAVQNNNNNNDRRWQ